MWSLKNDYKGNAHVTFIQVKKLNILSILEENSKPDAPLSDHCLHPELNQGLFGLVKSWVILIVKIFEDRPLGHNHYLDFCDNHLFSFLYSFITFECSHKYCCLFLNFI